MASTYTLYHGTFIQLPRHLPVQQASDTQIPKLSLKINTGVLWVSNADGKIQGFDWSVSVAEDEKDLNAFVEKKGWTILNQDQNEDAERETVVIVKGGRKGRNGFFFPGFIGMFSFYCILRLMK